MDTYRTEDEQVEALKKWWKENGRSTILGIVVAVALAGGWRSWQSWQVDQSNSASEIYHSLLEADALAVNNESQRSTAVFLAGQLREEHARTGYGHLAALFLARYAAEAGSWEEAEAQLQWLLSKKPEAALATQARLRLAQVLLATERYDQALAQLKLEVAPGYEALAEELRGDILLAKGDSQAALSAFVAAQAIQAANRRAGSNVLLDMKIQHIRQSAAGAGDTAKNESKEAVE